MRMLLTAVTCPKGDVKANLARHHDLVGRGTEAGCDIVLLPEMSLTGYRASAAIPLEHPAVRSLTDATVTGAAVCFGLVEQAAGLPYITQVVVAAGEVVAVHRKAHLPDDERADFAPGAGSGVFAIGGVTCSIVVCAEIGTPPPYRLGSRVVLAPAAPGLYGERRRTAQDWRRGFEWWRGSLTTDAKRLLAPDQFLAVSTQAGATEDEDFPGWAGLIATGGEIRVALPDWDEGSLIVDVD
jgi:predicted amidohydrolase